MCLRTCKLNLCVLAIWKYVFNQARCVREFCTCKLSFCAYVRVQTEYVRLYFHSCSSVQTEIYWTKLKSVLQTFVYLVTIIIHAKRQKKNRKVGVRHAKSKCVYVYYVACRLDVGDGIIVHNCIKCAIWGQTSTVKLGRGKSWLWYDSKEGICDFDVTLIKVHVPLIWL